MIHEELYRGSPASFRGKSSIDSEKRLVMNERGVCIFSPRVRVSSFAVKMQCEKEGAMDRTSKDTRRGRPSKGHSERMTYENDGDDGKKGDVYAKFAGLLRLESGLLRFGSGVLRLDYGYFAQLHLDKAVKLQIRLSAKVLKPGIDPAAYTF